MAIDSSDKSYKNSTSSVEAQTGAGDNVGKATGQENNWTTREDIDLIEKTVEDFRLQRLSMVQSLRQFALCYESVLEWLVEQHPKSA